MCEFAEARKNLGALGGSMSSVFTMFLDFCSAVTVFTSLSDQLHAAIWCAGDEAVAQVPPRQLPCIYAG